MDRLNVWRFALAAAIAFAVLSVVCALFVIVAPDATLAFFGTWFHGMDLRILVPDGGKPVTFAQVLIGAIDAAIVSFVGAAVLASCYNLLNSAARR